MTKLFLTLLFLFSTCNGFWFFDIEEPKPNLCQSYYFTKNFTRSEFLSDSSLRDKIINCAEHRQLQVAFNDSINMVIDFKELDLNVRFYPSQEEHIAFYSIADNILFDIWLGREGIYLKKYEHGIRKRRFIFIEFSQVEQYLEILNEIKLKC